MTSVTMKTHPVSKILAVRWLVATDPKEPFIYDMMAYVLSQTPYLMDQGMSGYGYVTPSMPRPFPVPGVPDTIAGFLGSTILQDTQDPKEVERIFKPLNDTIQARWPGKVIFLQISQSFDSFLDWYNVNYDQGQAGGGTYLASRLIDGKALKGDAKALAEAYKSAMGPGSGASAFMVAGKGVQEAKPAGGSNAVNPGWRKAYLHSREFDFCP